MESFIPVFFIWQNEDNMKRQLAGMIATLCIFMLGAVTTTAISGEAVGPQTLPAGTEPVKSTTTGTGKASAAIKTAEPITGAFGIVLGEHFETSMVARVLGKLEQKYRGKDGLELTGTLYRVEPKEPDERSQDYRIRTTEAGIIYAIEAYYEIEVMPDQINANQAKPARKVRTTCKNAVKALARELETRYGKPRGTGWDGEWFTFRQLSESSDRSLRVYANRCRTGLYSVVYTDEKLLHGLQQKLDRPATVNETTTGSSPAKP
jgi:hypothetical protein